MVASCTEFLFFRCLRIVTVRSALFLSTPCDCLSIIGGVDSRGRPARPFESLIQQSLRSRASSYGMGSRRLSRVLLGTKRMVS